MSAIVDSDDYAQLLRLADRTRLLDRRIAAEHEVTQLLADTPRLEAAAPRLLALMADLVDAELAELWTCAAGFIRPIAVWARDEQRYADFVCDTRSRRLVRGEGLAGRVWQTGETAIIDRLEDDFNFPRRAGAAAAGLTSAVAMPIASGGALIGVMEFFADRPVAADEDLRHTLTSIGHDIAHAVQRERHVQELERANQLKDDFLAILSHELRTPMNVILGWLQMLTSGAVMPEEWPRAIATVDRNARIQARLIDDLLDISRVVSGRMVVERSPMDFPAIVMAAVESLRPIAASKGITLEAQLPSSSAVLNGDTRRLQQVTLNLINNALKFTPAGGRVLVAVTPQRDCLELTVTDTGSGIDPAFLPHVFDRFRQGNTSMSREHGGLGLGLAIARHLIELHGGAITAHSDGLGRGATFTVRLPTT
jgi:signal transduction histidine kinase